MKPAFATLLSTTLFLLLAANVHAQVGSLQWNQALSPTAGAINGFAATSSAIFAGASDSGVYRSRDVGRSWVLAGNNGRMSASSVLWTNGIVMISGTFDTGLYRSDNLGATWEHLTQGPPGYIYDVFEFGGRLFAGTLDSGIYRSSDTGKTWLPANTGITMRNIHTFTSVGNTLFVGTHGDSIYRSTNFGDDWTPSSTGLPEGFIHGFAFVGTTMFVGTHFDAVYRSNDTGKTWSKASTGLVNPYIITFAVHGNSVFVATSDGLYRSTDLGDTWVRNMSGIPDSTTVLSLAIVGNTLLAGTSTAGLFRATLEVDNVAATSLPQASDLIVTPNPLTSSIGSLHYSLVEPGAVSILISDDLGREVLRTLSGIEQDLGNHDISIDVGSLAAGVYTCRVFSGNIAQVTRFVVSR